MSTLDITENLSVSLETACVRAGTNMTEVCRIAGVHRSTVQRWQEKEPKTFVEIRKIMQAIGEKEKQKQK